MMKYIHNNTPILLLTLICLILTSCSPTKNYYFYSEFKNADRNVGQDNKGQFSNNGELFDIHYYFTGQNLTMGVSLKNNTAQSVRIDWNKSTLKINDLSEKVISNMTGLSQSAIAPVIESQAEQSFEILKSAHFDMKLINNKKLRSQNIYVADKKTKTKSISFGHDHSLLVLTSNICIDLNGKDTIITNTFYISRISNINKKAYQTIKSESFDRKDGFYTTYEVDRGKENKFLNGVLEQLIKTGVNSAGTGEIRNHPKKYDEDTFYVPNR